MRLPKTRLEQYEIAWRAWEQFRAGGPPVTIPPFAPEFQAAYDTAYQPVIDAYRNLTTAEQASLTTR